MYSFFKLVDNMHCVDKVMMLDSGTDGVTSLPLSIWPLPGRWEI